MKKLFLLLAFLLPLGLMADPTIMLFKYYTATRYFWMKLYKPENGKENGKIHVKHNDTLICRTDEPFITFVIDRTRCQTSKEEIQSHIDNGDLKEVKKHAPKPKTVHTPFPH